MSEAGESRGAVALTVAWMLACLSTTVALFVVLTLRLLMAILPVARVGRHPLNNVADVLLTVAVTTGVCCLIFTPLAYRVRQTPPPRAISIAAVLIGLTPIITLTVQMLSRR